MASLICAIIGLGGVKTGPSYAFVQSKRSRSSLFHRPVESMETASSNSSPT